jgi:hypothetical protein
MIEPHHSLAFSIQANPGIFAVLVGSGVSRNAKIPTGWEITLELVRKLAKLHGEDGDSDPVKWYHLKYGCAPDYSKLLDEVAKTPAERQQLLHGYFEATEQEREEGLKQPTEAHKAIAGLVAGGFIKVILTTNFDRLIERALLDAGVTPTIISSKDYIRGAMPLIHTKCCIVKVHGDYKDTRILNTPGELASYSEELNSYLDRIFDEFGLIVCGWSADWDEALRSAIVRASNRRFSTYWATLGEPGTFAKDLIQHRGAQVIPVQGADTFFHSLFEQVKSLEAYSRPHPLSTAAAVVSLKRYLSEDRFRIQLADLVSDEVERVVIETRGARFPLQGCPGPNQETMTPRIKEIESICCTLIALASVGGEWSEEQQIPIWENAISRLTTTPTLNGNTIWIALQRYPAVLFLYAIGASAIVSHRYKLLYRILTRKITNWDGESLPVIRLLSPQWLSGNGPEIWRNLEGMDRRHVPLNDWIFDFLQPTLKRLVPDNISYEMAFDRFEVIFALAYAVHGERDNDWVPPGAFGYRYRNKDKIVSEIQESVKKHGNESPLITSGLLGNSTSEVDSALLALQNTLSHLYWR